MFRAHVLIIRRSKLYYTASGIITPIGVMITDNQSVDAISGDFARGILIIKDQTGPRLFLIGR